MKKLTGFFRHALVVIFFLGCITASAAEKTGHSGFAETPQAGWKAPDFSLQAITGETVKFRDYRGKVVFLYFWAPWCHFCKEEFPQLKKLLNRFKDRGLSVIAIAVDSRGNVDSFVKRNRADFPILIDQYGSAVRPYKVKSLPVSFVIGRDGTVLSTITGPKDYLSEEATGFFEELLK